MPHRRIREVAGELGLDVERILPHGHYIAKIPLAEYETRKERPDGSLILAVRDYGPGIPAQEMGKVFTVFYRVESEMVRKTSGTGIGLSLVKRLCAFLHIKITMANADPGPGLEVSFLIPPMPAESTGVQKIIEGEGGGAP